MVRFKAAYVSGVYRSGGAAGRAGRRPAADGPAAGAVHGGRGAGAVRRGAAAASGGRTARQVDDALADTVLDVIVRRLEAQGPAAHQVWLPPLDSPPSLDGLLPGLTAVQGRGLTQPGYEGAGRLVVPVGLVDKPFEQRRDPLWSDFSGAAGHMQIIGGPQSGKSTLLRTLIASFALTHTPYEVQFYGLDFGGGGMSAVAGLPHVGGVASRLDPERVRRTVAEVYGVLTRREEYFRSRGHRVHRGLPGARARGDISVTDQPWGDVFLVIDGWGNFRRTTRGWSRSVLDIAARGLGYGIHLILTASRSMEVRAEPQGPPDEPPGAAARRHHGLRDGPQGRRERPRRACRAADRRREKLHFMAAVPRIDGLTSDTDLADATAALAHRGRPALAGTRRTRSPAAAPRVPGRPAAAGRPLPAARRRLRPRRGQPRTGLRRLRTGPVLPRLRRERVGQVEPAAAAHQAADGAVLGRRGQAVRHRQPALAAGRDARRRTSPSTSPCPTRWSTTWTPWRT